MTDFNKTATDNRFYTELINRFFNSKSYFFICVKEYLGRPSLVNNNFDSSTIQIMSDLISHLVRAEQPAQELHEISRVRGLENIYTDLELRLIRHMLPSLEQPLWKKAIQEIALSFLRDTYLMLFNNEKGCVTLKKYLEIKAQLNEILSGSNGNHAVSESRGSDKQKNPALIDGDDFMAPDSAVTGLLAKQHKTDDDFTSSPVPDNGTAASFEINTSYGHLQPGPIRPVHNRGIDSLFPGYQPEKYAPATKDQHHLLTEDEDYDEDLLKIVNARDEPSEPTDQGEDVPELATDIATGLDGSEQPQDISSPDGDDFDAAVNEVFQQEAVLYFKILLNAISQLKQEDEAHSAYEDLELASASLKHLAQKFGMEKFALLPELMESISIMANTHIIKLPAAVLESIEEAVRLLKEFDPQNSDHKIKYQSHLRLLKEYYTRTLHQKSKMTVTSS